MGKETGISWTDATWNIAIGCSKVDEDCKFCYMYRDAERYGYDAKSVRKTKTVFDLPLKIKEPSKIFTSSLTDVFHPDIDSYRSEMWDIIRKCPHHTFQILTKRPERIIEHLPDDWGEGWDNVWLGTSIGSAKGYSRYFSLIKVPAKVRFLSLEPLHEDILKMNSVVVLPCDLTKEKQEEIYERQKNTDPLFIYESISCQVEPITPFDGISWVIIGGESGNEAGKYRYRPCKLEWIESIVHACKEAEIPVFVKQLGTHLSKEMGLKDRHGADINEWPEHLRIREFPKEELPSCSNCQYFNTETDPNKGTCTHKGNEPCQDIQDAKEKWCLLHDKKQ